ncbi:ferredoxin [Streptomyces gardneri]|uniref:ferredoxin n=1 Tax=Nocardia abscessus TaxID=120957 RepID=UPI0018959D2E|nr:ferredoxin [Nocardia abscessus]MBF6166965.1 ferredoxin [Streptomyces gardneri]MBF6221711.1 ferredoxin [Nocardia abscessus]MBF6475343.1 ferredoxin [Nocardia abscessus]
MMISVDYPRCEGHGLCAEQAPAVFSLDDAELIYRFEGTDVPDEYVTVARAAVDSCPVAALREQS